MALSNVTVGTAVTSQTSAGVASLATGSISPPSDCFLFVAGVQDSGVGVTISASTTLANVGAWTLIQQTQNAGNSYGFFLWAKVTGAPGTGTITVSFSTTPADAVSMVPGWLTGHNTTTPVAQSKTATGTAATASVTLTATPTSTSEVIGIITRFTTTNAAGTITPTAGFTEAAQQFIWNTSFSFGVEVELQYQNTGSPPANVTATALGTILDWTAIAVEVAVAAVPAGVVGHQLVHLAAIQRASGR